MMLFNQDQQQQNIMFDTRTNNISFIKMAVLLGKMGIKNNKFMLALTQPELVDYNPFNPKDTSAELKIRCAVECKINPWYYFREVIRLPAQGSENIQYILNRANMALMWLFFNDIDTFLTIARQIGKTVGAIGIESWLIYIAGFHINVGIFNKDNDLLKENVQRLKSIKEAIPDFIMYSTIKDEDNKEGLSYVQLENKFNTFVAQKDSRAAAGQGRGFTLIVQHWDELAYYENNFLSRPSALAASNTAQRQARAKGLPCANMITTTAGKLQDESGKYAYNTKMSCMRFAEWIYDLEDRPALNKVIDMHSTNHMVYIEFSYKQLGFDEAWFNEVTRNVSEEIKGRDYLNQWQHGTSSSALPKTLLDKIDVSLKEPFVCTYFESLLIRWYVDPKVIKSPEYSNRTYVIGCDTSDNVGRDFTTMVMIDVESMTLICTFRCNLSNWVHVASCICQFIMDFPRSILVPERNKNGAVLVDIIIDMLVGKRIDPLKRIYNMYYQDYNSDVDTSRLDLGSGMIRKLFGFNTSATSRDQLYKATLLPALDMNFDKLFDADLIDEIKGLSLRNGRIDHTDQGHDDLVVSYLLACFFVLSGKNHYMYGIDSSEMLSKIDLKGNHVDPFEKQRQIAMIERIKQLENLVESSISDLHKSAFSRELKHLKTMVSPDMVDLSRVSQDQVKQDSNQEVARGGLGSNTPLRILRNLF